MSSIHPKGGAIDLWKTPARQPARPAATRGLGWCVVALLVALPAEAADPRLARGEYLVTIGGCHDCHTPGHFLGKPDFARGFGSEVGFEVPGRRVPRIEPDARTRDRAGQMERGRDRDGTAEGLDGRQLAPVMPWRAFASLATPADAKAITAYLKSLKPIKSQVPGPFGPAQKRTGFVLKIVPPQP